MGKITVEVKTVGDLISVLSKIDEDTPVVVEDCYNYDAQLYSYLTVRTPLMYNESYDIFSRDPRSGEGEAPRKMVVLITV